MKFKNCKKITLKSNDKVISVFYEWPIPMATWFYLYNNSIVLRTGCSILLVMNIIFNNQIQAGTLVWLATTISIIYVVNYYNITYDVISDNNEK